MRLAKNTLHGARVELYAAGGQRGTKRSEAYSSAKSEGLCRRLDRDGAHRPCQFGAPGERTFYRVKVPNPPGSGKG